MQVQHANFFDNLQNILGEVSVRDYMVDETRSDLCACSKLREKHCIITCVTHAQIHHLLLGNTMLLSHVVTLKHVVSRSYFPVI